MSQVLKILKCNSLNSLLLLTDIILRTLTQASIKLYNDHRMAYILSYQSIRFNCIDLIVLDIFVKDQYIVFEMICTRWFHLTNCFTSVDSDRASERADDLRRLQ